MPPGTKHPSQRIWPAASRAASNTDAVRPGWRCSYSNGGPEHRTFGEALEQYKLGFDIISITSLEATVPIQDLLPFVAIKRPTRALRRAQRRPPLTTPCVVHFAPSPQGPLHIRSISGGPHALDTFLGREPLPPPALSTMVGTPSRSTPIKRSSSAQAPTRTKLNSAALPRTPAKRAPPIISSPPAQTPT
jgi:hypothetical protein